MTVYENQIEKLKMLLDSVESSYIWIASVTKYEMNHNFYNTLDNGIQFKVGNKLFKSNH